MTVESHEYCHFNLQDAREAGWLRWFVLNTFLDLECPFSNHFSISEGKLKLLEFLRACFKSKCFYASLLLLQGRVRRPQNSFFLPVSAERGGGGGEKVLLSFERNRGEERRHPPYSLGVKEKAARSEKGGRKWCGGGSFLDRNRRGETEEGLFAPYMPAGKKKSSHM